MDSQSVYSDISAKSNASRTYRPRYGLPPSVKPLTDCQKIAWMVSRIQQLDAVIERLPRWSVFPNALQTWNSSR
ncbi:hypothetical protein TNCT_676821 [Trichonephila clavata]|uniref:Uncharacterized protein n=1 Tax=Trichonephila clavata TaxID=2740835 RepID=A0A8X6F3U1_TRICU|nr:hypothetical protein TNCT_676821 [Trichonephila clavata]